MVERRIIAEIQWRRGEAGTSISLLCDMAYATDDSVIGVPHVKMGLVGRDGGAII